LLSAGLYKILAGYPKGEGMEYGLVNPWWGYWWRWYRRVRPDNLLFKTLNHLAYGTEILAAILLLIPSTQMIGALVIVGGFFFIATHIRLGFLCEMVMLSALLYSEPGSLGGRIIGSFMPATVDVGEASFFWFSPWLNAVLVSLLWGYILLLPLAHIGLYYNFLMRRSLPGVLQLILERYTNFFGIIIWRVFSIDVVNFFVNIYVLDKVEGKRPYSVFGALDWNSRFRFLHVGEFVCLASIFTTLKYYPSNRDRFREKLVRYAKTVPCPSSSVLLFEYISITKSKDGFDFVPLANFLVDIYEEKIEENMLDNRFPVREAHPVSPVYEAGYPGSYAPVRTSKKATS